MNEVFGFMLENTAGYLPDLIVSAFIVSFVVGFLIKGKVKSSLLRSCIYSIISAFVGVNSYSRNSIPNRGIEPMEAMMLGIAMFVVIFLIVAPLVFLKNRKKMNR